MRRHPPAWPAWPLAALSLAGIAASIATVWLWPAVAEAGYAQTAAASTIGTLWLVGAPLVGAAVASRRPGNAYGWLLLSFGFAGALFEATSTYGVVALVLMGGALPMGWVAALIADLSWAVMILHLPFLLLLFPDGRLPSPGWRWLVRAVAGLGALVLAVGPFQPGQMGSVPVANPAAAGGAAAAVIAVVVNVAVYALFATTTLAAASVFARRRRAGAQQRLQLRWFAYAAGLLGAAIAAALASAVVPRAEAMVDAVVPLLLAITSNALFAAIGVAVLRYRLYEIDRLVSRTVSYGVLSGVLAGVYVTGVLVMSRLLAPVGAGSELAVAAATLAAAALFAPARQRIQAAVDRRFNRARYDAEQVVDLFRDRLRGEVELEDVLGATRAAAVQTAQPERASLWLAGREVGR